MRFWKSWIVTQKDLSVIRKNKYVFYSLIAIPLILGIALPVLFVYTLNLELTSLTHDQFVAASGQLVDTATVYLILIAAVLPSILGSYSFVGEKVEKSLEPLLATPTTDSELLLGKSLATFLPCLAVTYLAAGISAAIIDVWSFIRVRVPYGAKRVLGYLSFCINTFSLPDECGSKYYCFFKSERYTCSTAVGRLSCVADNWFNSCCYFRSRNFNIARYFRDSFAGNCRRCAVLSKQGSFPKRGNSHKMEIVAFFGTLNFNIFDLINSCEELFSTLLYRKFKF